MSGERDFRVDKVSREREREKRQYENFSLRKKDWEKVRILGGIGGLFFFFDTHLFIFFSESQMENIGKWVGGGHWQVEARQIF